MIILGVDPGTATTGFGLIDYDSKAVKFVDGGVITTPAKQAPEQRLVTIFDEISQLIDEYHPEAVAVESLFFANNVTTAMSVSQARGVVLLAAAKAGLEVAEYTPLQIKQALTSYGRAEKSQVQAMIKKTLNLSELPKPDDAADALAVAICHSATLTV